MYTCLIVDDQTEAVELIKDHVSKVPQLSLQFATTDAVDALAFLDTHKPDVIFLDIEMPGITGIEFIENLISRWGNDIPKVVFTTGYGEYALTGYEHGVFDYIMKPVTFARFKKCTDRFIDELDRRVKAGKPDFFFVEEEGKKTKLKFDNIEYVEGAGNYIVIVTPENKKIVYRTMNSMQEILPADKFIRVHRSYIVAIDKIHAVKGNELVIKGTKGDKPVPIGISYKTEVMKLLGLN